MQSDLGGVWEAVRPGGASDSLKFEYQTAKWGKPENMELKTVDCGGGKTKVEVWLRDRDGVLCLDARDFICFEIARDGMLIKNQDTVGGSDKGWLVTDMSLL